ncbi:MAG: hypothetical protein JJU45_17420 [Acidimicrobiia bacterium]|nr:hypothetical protein [Acidimicrobiia bacterium]
MARLGSRGRTGAAAVAGSVVGGLAVYGLFALGVLQVERVVLDGPDAEEAFIEAWQRHRSGTFVVESDWRRTIVATGATLESASKLVQEPPNRIVRQFGAVRGRLDGRPVRCSTGPGGRYECFDSTRRVPPYADDVAGEIEELQTMFTAGARTHRVHQRHDGCFVLTHVAGRADPPYGREGVLCFDDETGALTSVRRDYGRIVEESQALTVRPSVTQADFSLEEDATFTLEGDVPDLLEQLLQEREAQRARSAEED